MHRFLTKNLHNSLVYLPHHVCVVQKDYTKMVYVYRLLVMLRRLMPSWSKKFVKLKT